MLVEMHAHVICGVDDGPRSEQDMQRMLTMAAKGGVSHIVCTSHIRPGEADYPAKRYRENLARAQAFCEAELPQLQLHAGAEILYTPDTPWMLADGLAPTLAGSRAVLVEFRPATPERELLGAAEQLLDEGRQVIVAHVERCRALSTVRQVRRLRALGAMTQMNAAPIIDEQAGFFFRRYVSRLLDEGLIDFVASDAHNTTSRAFCLRYAHRNLAARLGEKEADALCGDRFAALMGWL